MKFFLAYLCTAIFFISPGLVASADVPGTAMVESIRFMGERDGAEVIHFKLNRELEPNVFELLGKNPRMVFDFIETGYSAKEKRVIKVGGRLVKKIRVGRHNEPVDKTRIVIDLTSEKECTIDREFLMPDMVLEVRVFLKSSGTGNKAAYAEQKSIKEEKVKNSKGDSDLEQGKTSLSSATVVDNEIQADSEKGINKGVVETALLEKSTAEVGKTSEMSGSIKNKNQVNTSEATDLPKAKKAPVLLDVSYENTTNNKEMVLFKMSGFYPPVVFAIEEEEPRIVCDFLDVQLGANTKQVLHSGGQYISKVRVAKHSNPDKVRVVLDLVADNDYDLKQVFFKEDNLFVVIISTL